MRVTIITACYNRGKTIKDAAESVMRQTYQDIEYIVMDGGSTDGSVETIRSVERQVNSEEFRDAHPGFSFKFISEPDNGMYEAINKGIRMATGDVIALCHSDDQLFDEHTVEDVVEQFKKHTEADMVYADGVFVNERGKAVRVWKGGKNRRWKLNCGWLPLHTTFYIKKSVFEKYGLYDESYRIAADTKMLMTLMYKERLKTTYLPQFVVRMLMGGKSTAANKQREMWHEDVRVFRELGFCCPRLMKMMKMAWKPIQFVKASAVKQV